jgi:hypothetical protein
MMGAVQPDPTTRWSSRLALLAAVAALLAGCWPGRLMRLPVDGGGGLDGGGADLSGGGGGDGAGAAGAGRGAHPAGSARPHRASRHQADRQEARASLVVP